MAEITAGFETGVHGVQASTSDPGDATAFTQVSVVGGGTMLYDNSVEKFGSLCMVASAWSSGLSYIQWDTTATGGSVTDWYGRMYVRVWDGTPGDVMSILQCFNDAGSTQVGRISIQTDGTILLRLGDGAATAASASTIPADSWFRLEFRFNHNASTGIVTAKYFADPDASSPTEEWSTSTGNGGTSMGIVRIGMNVDGTQRNNGTYTAFDQVVLNATGYPGPYSAGGSARVARQLLLTGVG